MPETIKLVESTKSKLTKDGNGKNVPQLEITELLLVLCRVFPTGEDGDGGSPPH